MDPSMASESLAIMHVFRGLLDGLNKHCGTLKALSDQIMAMEKCDKDDISVSQDVFDNVRVTIQNKISEEVYSLSQLMVSMEEQHSAMTTLFKKVAASCQHQINKRDRNSGNLNQSSSQLLKGRDYIGNLEQLTTHLHSFESLSYCIYFTITMMRVYLQRANPDDISSIHEFKEVNSNSKALMSEMDSVLRDLESDVNSK